VSDLTRRAPREIAILDQLEAALREGERTDTRKHYLWTASSILLGTVASFVGIWSWVERTLPFNWAALR
jgi:hypothetical protein